MSWPWPLYPGTLPPGWCRSTHCLQKPSLAAVPRGTAALAAPRVMCLPRPDSLCCLLFSSLSASSSWMKGMPSMRRNTDSLGLRSPSERLPAGTQGRHGGRAVRCYALGQDTGGCLQ